MSNYGNKHVLITHTNIRTKKNNYGNKYYAIDKSHTSRNTTQLSTTIIDTIVISRTQFRLSKYKGTRSIVRQQIETFVEHVTNEFQFLEKTVQLKNICNFKYNGRKKNIYLYKQYN